MSSGDLLTGLAAQKARDCPARLQNGPWSTPGRRLDEATAVKEPRLRATVGSEQVTAPTS